jgi:hypothetical protein
VNNNPVRYTDPTGHRCVSDHDEECQNDDSTTGSGFTGAGSASSGGASNGGSGQYGANNKSCSGQSCGGKDGRPPHSLLDLVQQDDATTALSHPTNDEIMAELIVGFLLLTLGAIILASGFGLIAAAFSSTAFLLGGSVATIETIFGVIELAHLGAGMVALIAGAVGVGGGVSLFGGYHVSKWGVKFVSSALSADTGDQ